MNKRALAAALAVAATTITTGLSATPAFASGSMAPCVPNQLPSIDGGNGEVMWINDSGLAVGTVGIGQDASGNPISTASYWTPGGSGYQLHLLPNDPLVDDEVLDVNQSDRMVDYGVNPATGNNETYVFDLPSNTWWHVASIGGSDTRGRRINAAGVVAGGGLNTNGRGFALTWAPPYTSATRLANNGLFPYAPGINDEGDAVGATNRQRWNPSIDDAMRHSGAHAYFPLTLPVAWRANGTSMHLPVIYTQGEAFAINNAGTTVGSADVNNNEVDAAYWVNGVAHSMGGVPGGFTEARGLSQGGWAVGDTEFGDGTGQAFVWTGAGTLQHVAALDGPDGNSNAHGVDDHLRQIGGWSDTSSTTFAPTIWQCPIGFTTA